MEKSNLDFINSNDNNSDETDKFLYHYSFKTQAFKDLQKRDNNMKNSFISLFQKMSIYTSSLINPAFIFFAFSYSSIWYIHHSLLLYYWIIKFVLFFVFY